MQAGRWTDQRCVLDLFCLNIVEIGPRLLDQIGTQQKIERCRRLHFRAGSRAFVGDRSGHRNRVGPTVTGQVWNIRTETAE